MAHPSKLRWGVPKHPVMTAEQLIEHVAAYPTDGPVRVPLREYTMVVLSLASIVGTHKVVMTPRGGVMVLGRELVPG